MEKSAIEVSIVYKDHFSEVFNINIQEWERTMTEAKDENREDFHIGENKYSKKEVALVATSNSTIQFL